MSLPILPIQTAYMSSSDISRQPQAWQDNALGAVCFVNNPDDCDITMNIDVPAIQLHAPVLDGIDASCEIWLSDMRTSTSKVLENSSAGAIQFRCNDEFLFGVITLAESVQLQSQPNVSALQQITESAYRQIFALMDKMNYPHIYRFWNYMADINGISHGLERYRQFNVGRKDALAAYSDSLAKQLPAACALGVVDGPLTIAFLLGRKAPIAIENPRQVSAYEYPEEYGPQTPSFSRATLLDSEHSTFLFISGTASIVGHQSVHSQDVVAQTRETLANLEAVIAEANRTTNQAKFDLHHTFLRVYLRYAADLSLVRNEIQRHLGSTTRAVFIQADICRQELLLEIEATAECNRNGLVNNHHAKNDS